MENVTMGQMINYWRKEKGSIGLDTTAQEIMDFYKQNHREPIEFTYWVSDNKESIDYFLREDERGPQLTEEEIAENELRYCFYEVSFQCVYENGNIYITHCNGEKLENRALA